MVRWKPKALRYGGILYQEEQNVILEEETLDQKYDHEEKLQIQDLDKSLKNVKREYKILNQITNNDIKCCLNIWENIKMNILVKDENNELFNINQEKEFIVIFRIFEENKSRFEVLVLDDQVKQSNKIDLDLELLENTDSLNENQILGIGSLSWTSLKPKIPNSQVKKALILLQDANFIVFTCQFLSMKKINTFTSTTDTEISYSNKDQKYCKVILNMNLRIYLSNHSFDIKLLSRKRDAKSSLKMIFSWLYDELKFPTIENSNIIQTRKRKNSNQSIQIKPNELYSIFQEYDLSKKRMSSFKIQNQDWMNNLGLISNLRNYQKDAVLFALSVEMNTVEIKLEYPPYWFCQKIKKSQGNEVDLLYFNMITGQVNLNIQPQGGGTFHIRGGFLCDEMGLGKSLEIITLILINPRKDYDNYFSQNNIIKQDFSNSILQNKQESLNLECPCGINNPELNLNIVKCKKCGILFHFECCISDQVTNLFTRMDLFCSLCQSVELSERIKVKATLIIAPASIIDQWYDEFNKHLEFGRLKVVKYQGVRFIQNYLRNKNRLRKLINDDHENDFIKTRRDILNYDVVLTSYEILKEEIYHVLDENTLANKRCMRFKKSYPILASLIINIDWWRIVLDEAQMTEGYSLISKMTNKLICYNKWCVSGTPIVKSCSNDLIGLLLNLSNVGFTLINDSLYKKYLGYLSSILYVKSSKDPSKFDPDLTFDFTNDQSFTNYDHDQDHDHDHNYGTSHDHDHDHELCYHTCHEKNFEFLQNENSLDYITNEYKSIQNLVNHLQYVIGSLFYRREMKQVKEEVNIPRAFYGNTFLNLSSIERFFYIKQCESGYNNIIHHKNQQTLFKNKNEIDSIVTLLRLACIHPQLGIMGISSKTKDLKNQSNNYLNIKNHHDSSIASLNTGLKIMTMDQILDKLLNKCRIEIEETVRKYVMNTLGLAGIHFHGNKDQILNHKSISYYKQVLEIRKQDRVDILQQIHTLWNLGEITQNENERKELINECNELEIKYRNKYYKDFLEKYDILIKARDKSNSLYSKDNWWYIFKKFTKSKNYYGGIYDEDQLLYKIENFQYEFKSAKDGDSNYYLPKFNSIHSLIITIDFKINNMQESRSKLLQELNQLELLRLNQNTEFQLILDEMIAKISNCFICKENDSIQIEERKKKKNFYKYKKLESCIFCMIQTHIEELEYSLYTIKKKNFVRLSESSNNNILQEEEEEENDNLLVEKKTVHHDSTYLRDSEMVAILKLLNKELRRSTFKLKEDNFNEMDEFSSIYKISTNHLKYIESLKIELSNSKAFISSTRQLINSYLELIDCKQRIQVIQSDEENLSSNQNNIIHYSQVELFSEKYESERISALSIRRNLKSQQKFLCNLKLQQKSKKMIRNDDFQDDEICPICLNKLKEEYSQVLLPCAHIICIDCYKLISKKSNSNKFKNQCPKCRQSFQDTNVVLIVPDNNNNNNIEKEKDFEEESMELNKQNHVDFGINYKIIESINIIGNFGTKIEAIIKHIKWILNYSHNNNIQSINENDKIIIFSDFQPVIDILSSALHLNEILFKKYNGGKSEYNTIREFSSNINTEKNDYKHSKENYRVLLCNHLNVGKGVNITAANHIIFISPLVNKSDELQAIGRIIRMGQTKTPHIWNFIINDSVDELIFNYLSNFYSDPDPKNPSFNSNNQHSLSLKIIQHVLDTNFKQRENLI